MNIQIHRDNLKEILRNKKGEVIFLISRFYCREAQDSQYQPSPQAEVLAV